MAEAEGSKLIVNTLTEYGKLGVLALRTDVQEVSATGKTADSIRFEISVEADRTIVLRFLGREYFKALETGRGPRKSSEYQQYDVSLEEWLESRGLPSKTSKSGVKYFKLGEHWLSAKSLAWKINKEGDATYKKGGRIVYSPTLTKLAEEIKRAIVSDFRKFIVSEVIKR
jgi:hypothetical protein